MPRIIELDKRAKRALIQASVCCLLLLCGRGFASESGDFYKIQPGDILQIDVWKEQNMQREVLVQPDGRFSFPLAGEIDATGKTAVDIDQELERRLSKFIADPSATVSVMQTQGNKVYVIGQVHRPGEFIMVRQLDVLQALAMSGGLTPFAGEGGIKIIRRGRDGTQQVFRFDYDDIKDGKKLEQNMVLQGGDVVVIP